MGSLDAVSLYPSLVIKEVGKICAEKVIESKVKFENADIAWACKYVALAMDENEVVRRELNDVIPRRKAKTGRKATLRTVVMDDYKERWKFRKLPEKYSEKEKSKVMSLLVEYLVKVTLKHICIYGKGK